MARVKVPLTLNLSEAHFKKIIDAVEGEGEDAQKFALFTQEAIEAIAKGAILLQPEVSARLLDIEVSLGDPDVLISAVERGMGVREGAMVAKWNIDPSLYEPLRQRAETNGTTVENLVQEMMDQAVSMGWFFDLNAEVKTLFFTHEQFAELCKALDEKDVTGDMLMSRIVQPLPGEPESPKLDKTEGEGESGDGELESLFAGE